ncbi:chromate transporter [Denitratisoma oestradiolicum]|uniref:Chromate transporter n=1 Tax=Denitratisoma oestradiolicum TaxID=311182 RepID=A0A6S6XUM0_9PROT|nr:chromate transporter [Denitratisoma oestradiolicum]TWO81146.1 hypothetical protein CBW56_05945 [Denitratisoma oestradiolicum]CAB1367833.1 Chromate transporter [Denitratisoma oestradiolicum]
MRPAGPTPGLVQLFLAFQGISLRAFGGALPWARRELVDQRRWLEPTEFANLLALCQFLPGPNIGNLAVLVGSRYRGIPGALAALLGLLAAPVAIVILLGMIYDRYGQMELMGRVLNGVAAAAAGLIADMALKMARPLERRGARAGLLFLLATFVAVGLLRLPLGPVMLVLAPLSILAARPR